LGRAGFPVALPVPACAIGQMPLTYLATPSDR
jgi:hypothetical protein